MSQRPPRVILVMNARWHRALLRAALRDAGYDAVGAADLTFALRYGREEPGRGPVAVIVVDGDADPSKHTAALRDLFERHGRPPAILITSAGRPATDTAWTLVLRRPLSVADIVAAVQRLLPLPANLRHPLDE